MSAISSQPHSMWPSSRPGKSVSSPKQSNVLCLSFLLRLISDKKVIFLVLRCVGRAFFVYLFIATAIHHKIYISTCSWSVVAFALFDRKNMIVLVQPFLGVIMFVMRDWVVKRFWAMKSLDICQFVGALRIENVWGVKLGYIQLTRGWLVLLFQIRYSQITKKLYTQNKIAVCYRVIFISFKIQNKDCQTIKTSIYIKMQCQN